LHLTRARGYGKSGVTNQYPTLGEMGYEAVSKSIKCDVRTSLLTWSHHRAVMEIASDKQRHWLELAAIIARWLSFKCRRLYSVVLCGRNCTRPRPGWGFGRVIDNRANGLSCWNCWEWLLSRGGFATCATSHISKSIPLGFERPRGQ